MTYSMRPDAAPIHLRKQAVIAATAVAALLSAAPVEAAGPASVTRPDAYAVRVIDKKPGNGRFDRASRVARNPADGLLYRLAGRSIVASDRSGARRSVISLRRVALRRPRAIAIRRSGDPTDAPATRHIYLVDRGGRVVELGVESGSVPASAAAVSTVTARLLRTIATSGWSPSSPDPSGIAYDAANGRFIVSDGEVEEMPLYKGFNLWTAPLGSLHGTGSATTVGNSKEPTGLTLNPTDRTLYITDDDAHRIVVAKPGADGLHGTADDSTTRVGTAAYGIADPEDIAYDTRLRHLFVCDGLGREIWDIDPVNGVLGDAGDHVKHFDLGVHGLSDCEGVAYDRQRDTLVVADPNQKYAYEFTRSGSLARRLDMRSIAGADVKLAGITLAPSSSPNDSSSTRSYFLVDRRVDNGIDPGENDGRLYEVATRSVTADPPPSVSVTAPVAGSTVAGAVALRASASDSGGVTQVRFRVDNVDVGVDTSASGGWTVSWATQAAGNGPHQITAIATDTAGNTSAAAPITVNVNNHVQQTITVPIATGNDDADEIADGTVRRTTGDLELGSDQGIPTTVALRFAGLTVPRGVVVQRASVQLNADELDRAAATLSLRAEAGDNSAPFAGTAFNLSSRPLGAGAVSWSVPIWTVFGAAGLEQQTPDLSALVQEVIDRPGWTPGNALTLLIAGSGRRTAESLEGGFPPTLTVEFASP